MSNVHFKINYIPYKLTEKLSDWDDKKAPTSIDIARRINSDVRNRANFRMGIIWAHIGDELRVIKEAERLRKWRATMKARYGK